MADPQPPAPPVPPTVDLRMFSKMPLDVVRLKQSAMLSKTRPEEFRAAILLWGAAWHQVPASSLPDDDAELAQLAGYGFEVKAWRKVRAGALRGFVKCADGKFYHGVLAEIAIGSWGRHLKQRHQTECYALKKRQQRANQKVDLPTFALWITEHMPDAIPYVSRWTKGRGPEDEPGMSPGPPGTVPRENGSNRGEGIGSSINQLHGDGSNMAPDVPGTARAKPGKSNPAPKPGSTAWEAWVKREGERLGMKPVGTESWDQYGARVRAAVDHEKLEHREHASQR